MQAKAVVAKVARRGRLDDRIADEHRQDRGSGKEAEEEDVDRGLREGCPRAALPQATETLRPGDHLSRGQFATRERGSQGVVL